MNATELNPRDERIVQATHAQISRNAEVAHGVLAAIQTRSDELRDLRILASNTQGFESLVEQALKRSIQLPRPAIPPVLDYCTMLPLSGVVVGGKANIALINWVQAVQENPTTFENSNDGVENAQPTLTHYSAQFGFNNPDQNTGLELLLLLASHLTEIEKRIQTQLNSVITTTNFGAAVVTAASGSFTVSNLETLIASVPARTVVALDSAWFVRTKSTWMPAGEEGKLRELSHISGMGDDIRGFAARPEAIAIPYGYPVAGPASDIKTSMIQLPIGINVQFSRWWQRSGRSWRGSLDISLGAEVGQAAALRILKTA